MQAVADFLQTKRGPLQLCLDLGRREKKKILPREQRDQLEINQPIDRLPPFKERICRYKAPNPPKRKKKKKKKKVEAKLRPCCSTGQSSPHAPGTDLALLPDIQQLPAVGAVPLGRAGGNVREADALEVEPLLLAILSLSELAITQI